MQLPSHIIAAVAAGAVLTPIIGLPYAALFAGASVLIDADHYLDYLWDTRFRNWSPKRMFQYFDEDLKHIDDPHKLGFSLLHTVELFLVIYLIALTVHVGFLNYTFFIVILGGMAYHIIFDVVWLTWVKKVPFKRPYSITEYFIRKNAMIKKGLNPDGFSKRMWELSEPKN